MKRSYSSRNIAYEIKTQKATEQELGREFITIDNVFKIPIKYLEASSNSLNN